MSNIGEIRVGRCLMINGKRVYPKWDEVGSNGLPFIQVPIITGGKYKDLSPYELKDEDGCIMENMWQNSKLYKQVPKSTQRYSRWDNTVIWEHPAETHVHPDTGKLLPEYVAWREKLCLCQYAVRYPVGMKHRHECIGAIRPQDIEKVKGLSLDEMKEQGLLLDYIEARKKIYASLYIKLAKKTEIYYYLLDLLNSGKNLLIIDVDGPHQEAVPYYKENYAVNDDFIEKDTVLVTKKNMKILLNDRSFAFGHGYVLACSLMGWTRKSAPS